MGGIAMADTPRSEAASAIKSLESIGLQCAILTGDNYAAAAAVAGSLGIAPAHVHAGLLPRDKLAKVMLSRSHFGGAHAVGSWCCF